MKILQVIYNYHLCIPYQSKWSACNQQFNSERKQVEEDMGVAGGLELIEGAGSWSPMKAGARRMNTKHYLLYINNM